MTGKADRPTTISDLNWRFRYEADRTDGWTALQGEDLRGDCDDYALTAALIMADWSWLRFWFHVLTFQTRFHHVRARHNGESHLVLYVRGPGYIDNIYREWMTSNPHPKNFPWVALPPIVALKILAGKFRD